MRKEDTRGREDGEEVQIKKDAGTVETTATLPGIAPSILEAKEAKEAEAEEKAEEVMAEEEVPIEEEEVSTQWKTSSNSSSSSSRNSRHLSQRSRNSRQEEHKPRLDRVFEWLHPLSKKGRWSM